jgi:DnaJ-class molecular chaperone
MSETRVCPTCRGRKRYPQMGGVETDCSACNGVGTITEPKTIIKVVAGQYDHHEPLEKRRPGKKKRSKHGHYDLYCKDTYVYRPHKN